jgi:hypothetical protein
VVKAGKLTEKQFMAQVVKLATLCGWRVYHTYDSRRCVAGFPDLVLVHRKRGLVVWAELKVGKNTTTPEQEAWLDDLFGCGQRVTVWRPEQWPAIEALLTGRDS